MNKSLLAPALTLVVGLVLGIAIGFHSRAVPRHNDHTSADSGGDTRPAARDSSIPGIAPAATSGVAGRRTGVQQYRSAMKVSDPVVAAGRFALALHDLNEEEIASAAKDLWAKPGNPIELNERKRLLAYRWGQVEGAAAVEFAHAQTGQGKLTAISGALAGWASADPAAAKAWIADTAQPAVRSLYDLALVDGWARQDIASATDHVFDRPVDRNSERMIRAVAAEHTRQDPEAAGAWATGLPDGALRDSAISEVATRWVWANGPAAIVWVAGLPQSGEMQSAMKETMRIWTRRDPRAASEHVSEMAGGVAKDHAISGLSRAVATEDPDASAAWAATISDATLRQKTLAVVGAGDG